MAAQRAGATKLATGHNLDDEAQSVLMNVFRGDLPRLIRNSGVDSSGKFIPRIKPLSLISEKEIATYLILKNAWNELPECPYTRYALRREVRSILSDFEYKHPGTMLHLMESKEKIEHSCAGSDDLCPPSDLPDLWRSLQRGPLPGMPSFAVTGKMKDLALIRPGNSLRVRINIHLPCTDKTDDREPGLFCDFDRKGCCGAAGDDHRNICNKALAHHL